MIETSSYQYITLDKAEGVATLVLANPDKRNALSLQTMHEIISALDDAGRDGSIKVVVLRALGSVFSSGHDLRQLQCSGNAEDVVRFREIFDVCVRMMEKIQAIPQPVIAEVTGIATAAGCQLVATCDLAIAASDAKFATPGVKNGLFCTTPMVALSRAVGRKRAMEMLLTGEYVDAETAAEWGLINRAVPPDVLRREVDALARKIVAASGFTIGLGKAAFYTQIDLDQQKAYAYAKEVMSMNALAADAQEGIAAFFERRAPVWTR